MKKIACVGYHASGSGVIDDLLREFDNVAQGEYNVETRVLQDPDGISDLEYNLVNNPHRLNSGYAVKRFLKYVQNSRFSYRRIFGPKWISISEKYASSLVKIDYHAFWFADLWLKGILSRSVYRARRGFSKLLPRGMAKPSTYDYFPKERFFHVSIDENEFLEITRNYIEDLCGLLNKDQKEYVVLDQIMPPLNNERYFRYVDDLKVIVVDRDPRDVFIDQYQKQEHVLPLTPYEFAVVYNDTHKLCKNLDSSKCLYIDFEFLVCHYEEAVKTVLEFLGIDPSHHLNKKSYFDPAVSIKNTQQWKRLSGYEDAMAIIEKECKEYLHDY